MNTDMDRDPAAREWAVLTDRWEDRMGQEWAALMDQWVVTEWGEIPGGRLRRREEEAAGAA